MQSFITKTALAVVLLIGVTTTVDAAPRYYNSYRARTVSYGSYSTYRPTYYSSYSRYSYPSYSTYYPSYSSYYYPSYSTYKYRSYGRRYYR